MKKQSQNKPNFRKAKMNVGFYLTKTYENNLCSGLLENKPKQSQFQNRSQLVRRSYSEDGKTEDRRQMTEMTAKSALTRDYENIMPLESRKNKANQTQLSAWSRFLEPGHRHEKGHHDDCCHEQAPSWGKAQRAGQVGKHQGKTGDEQAVGQLRANVLDQLAGTGGRTYNCRVGDG